MMQGAVLIHGLGPPSAPEALAWFTFVLSAWARLWLSPALVSTRGCHRSSWEKSIPTPAALTTGKEVYMTVSTSEHYKNIASKSPIILQI